MMAIAFSLAITKLNFEKQFSIRHWTCYISYKIFIGNRIKNKMSNRLRLPSVSPESSPQSKKFRVRVRVRVTIKKAISKSTWLEEL